MGLISRNTQLPQDAAVKEKLHVGLQDLVKKGDENGIWEVVCCASAAHEARVNELENLRIEVNAYKVSAQL